MDDNGDDAPGQSVEYRRRLDRTPDKNFERLPQGEKKLLSTLRSALEEAKSRIVRLRDENENKDGIIDLERHLRREAENRLEKYLVDLYNNPDVNTELRQRLPRARKVDPLHQDPGSDMNNGCLATLTLHVSDDNSESVEISSANKGDVAVADGSVPVAHRNGMVKDNVQPLISVSVDNTESPPQIVGQPSTQQFNSRQFQPIARDHHVGCQTESSSSSSMGATQGPSINMSQWLPPYIHPSAYINPLSSASWSSLESSSYHGLPSVQRSGTVEPGSYLGVDKKEKDEGPVNDGDTRQRERSRTADDSPHVTFSTSQAAAPAAPVFPPPSYNNGKSHPVQQMFMPPQLPPYPYHNYGPNSFRTYYGSDNVSHISRLLAEIATLKKENEELRDKLKDAKKDIELLKIDTSITEDPNLDKIGALIEEIHAAEKKRDKAVKMMMEAADEDKSVALGQLDRVKLRHARRSVPVRSVSDSELTDMDNSADDEGEESSVSESAGSGHKKATGSRRYLEQLVARQREIMKEEMQKVMDQRNEARGRVMKLEKKLSELKLSQFSNKQADTLLAKLRITEKERDMVVARLKFLTQDVNETKLVYNLHKALLSDDPANDASTYNGYHGDKLSNLDLDPELTKNNPMTARLSHQMEEKAKLEGKLGMLEKEKQEQTRQIEKLEQLVKRQRQKLNTLCAGPMLVESE